MGIFYWLMMRAWTPNINALPDTDFNFLFVCFLFVSDVTSVHFREFFITKNGRENLPRRLGYFYSTVEPDTWRAKHWKFMTRAPLVVSLYLFFFTNSVLSFLSVIIFLSNIENYIFLFKIYSNKHLPWNYFVICILISGRRQKGSNKYLDFDHWIAHNITSFRTKRVRISSTFSLLRRL